MNCGINDDKAFNIKLNSGKIGVMFEVKLLEEAGRDS